MSTTYKGSIRWRLWIQRSPKNYHSKRIGDFQMKKQALSTSTTFAVLLAILAGGSAVTGYASSEQSKMAASEVSVDNFTFGPETITVAANSTVTWVNHDDVPHVIASTDGLFRSKALDTDDKYSFTFAKPGTYQYFCTVHPKMVGKIIVR
jgi:plastocyanin